MTFTPSERKRAHRCERKKPLTETVAERIAQQARTRLARNKDVRMIAYKCYYGEHWHIGHVHLDSRQWRLMKAEGIVLPTHDKLEKE